jgi:acyl-CoA thioester hydrolase
VTDSWFTLPVRVRYAETDAMGFLHHANHAVYLEMARTELFRAHGGDYAAMERGGLFLVVVKLECRYLKPARYDDLLEVRCRISRLTPAKLEHEYEIVRDGEVLCRASSTLACVDREGNVRRIPELPGTVGFGGSAS